MSSTGLPPEEVEYQESHLYENYTRNLAGLYIVLVTLAFISMVLRVASRRITDMRLAADDWTFLVGATLGEASFFVSLIYVFDAGLGEHWVALTPDQQVLFHKLNYAFNIFNLASYPVIKISILLLYIRIFVSKTFQLITWGFVCFVAAVGISNTLVAIFACRPVQAFYDTSVSGVCINDVQFYWATAVLNVFTDIVILVLPVPLLWKIQTTFRRKLGISLLFVTGGLTFVVSIIRIVYYLQYSSDDPSYTFLGTAFATPSEVCLAIMVASAPTWRPTWMVLARYGRDKFDSFFSRGSRNDPRTLQGDDLVIVNEKGDGRNDQASTKLGRKKQWINTSRISPFKLSKSKPAMSHESSQYPTGSENSNTTLLTHPHLSLLLPARTRQAIRSPATSRQLALEGHQSVAVADASALGVPNLNPESEAEPRPEQGNHRHSDPQNKSNAGGSSEAQTGTSGHNLPSHEAQTQTSGSVHLDNGAIDTRYWDAGMARPFGYEDDAILPADGSRPRWGIRVDREVAIISEREGSEVRSNG